MPLDIAATDYFELSEGYKPFTNLITNGLGAGPDVDFALGHGLLELLQRDGNGLLFRALDQGVMLDLSEGLGPETRGMLDRLDELGIKALPKFATDQFGLTNLYVVGYDRNLADTPVPIALSACGEACDPDRERALRKALLEFQAARVRKAFGHGPLAFAERVTPPGYVKAFIDKALPSLDLEESRALKAMLEWIVQPPEGIAATLRDTVYSERSHQALHRPADHGGAGRPCPRPHRPRAPGAGRLRRPLRRLLAARRRRRRGQGHRAGARGRDHELPPHRRAQHAEAHRARPPADPLRRGHRHPQARAPDPGGDRALRRPAAVRHRPRRPDRRRALSALPRAGIAPRAVPSGPAGPRRMSLRFAYNTNGTAHHRLDDAIDLIAEAGYQGVALTLDIHHLDPFAESWRPEAQRVSSRLQRLGLGSVIETGARFLLDPKAKHEPTLVSGDAAGRARRIGFLKRAIDIAAILHSEAVSFWAGVPKPGIDPAEAQGWLREGLTEVVAYAAEQNVVACLEPEPGMLIETLDDYAALDLPGLKLALDTGHCLVTGERDPAVAVARVRRPHRHRGDRGHGAGRPHPPALRRGRHGRAGRAGRPRRDPVRPADLRGALPREPPGRPDGAGLAEIPPRLPQPEPGSLRVRICFVSRRYFPAISGMSVYAQNLLRELVEAGHDVTMISQYRGDAFGTRVYGGGPPPAVPGVTVIGLEQVGEQESGDFERDIDTMVATIRAEHARKPFDILHAQYGYPTGWATLLASRTIGVPNVVSIQGGDGHWVGSCCETHRVAMCEVLAHANALLIGGASFVEEVCDRLGSDPARFTIVPGAVDTARFTPGGPATMPARCGCSITAASTAGKACSTSSTPWRCCAPARSRSRRSSPASGPTWSPRRPARRT